MDVSTLKQTVKGTVILPGDSEYEKAGSSPFFKGEPAAVVQPANTADVAAAIAFAKEHSVVLSIKSGGHSIAGFSTNTDGMVLDMSGFNSIEVTDPEKGTVRIGTGAVWGDVAKKLGEHNLALSSGDTKSVGVGGLTLGGGIGWMVRKYGLALDNLIGAEIITADGNVLHLSETENADLFWAIRGGGGNFGVITYFEFQAHKVGTVYAGTIMFSLDNLKGLIKGWSDYMRMATDDLTTSLMIMPEFMGNPPGAMLQVCYNGDETAGKQAIEPLLKLGKVTMQNVQVKDYVDVLEEAHPPQGIKVVVNNCFIKAMNDEIIEMLANMLGKPGSPIVQMRSLGGAMARVLEEATAFANRTSEVWMMIPTFVPIDATPEAEKRLLEPWELLKKYSCGAYSCFISDTKADISDIYPEATYKRLLEIKKKYDPDNIFNQNFNIV